MIVRLLLLLALLVGVTPAEAAGPYQTGFARWRAIDGAFAEWELDGVVVGVDGALRLDGGDVGQALGPVTPTAFPFREAVPSWNALTPAATWIEVDLRARVGGRWTTWRALGIWASDAETTRRRSVRGQDDADAKVAVDTIELRRGDGDAFQLRVRLFGDGAATPVVHNLAVAYSMAPTRPNTPSVGDPALWGRALHPPRCSQMLYPDGGRVWCSPTSTAMILGYWEDGGRPCEPRVRDAVARVYDWSFRGHGNWPFNVAYAATQGYEGYVARFASLADAEPWIAAGVPVAFSFAFGPGELPGAPLRSVNGHLAVLVGFDADGDPVVHDPAAPTDASVRRTYPREQLERVWIEHSGGTVYLIYPPGWAVPPLG